MAHNTKPSLLLQHPTQVQVAVPAALPSIWPAVGVPGKTVETTQLENQDEVLGSWPWPGQALVAEASRSKLAMNCSHLGSASVRVDPCRSFSLSR